MQVDFTELIIKNYKKIIIVILALVGLVLLVGWVYNSSRIKLVANGGSSGSEYSFILTNQLDSKPSASTTQSPEFSTSSSRGNYQALIQQDSNSYFQVFEAPGFFQETVISGDLIPEKSRTFIGNNPGACMDIISNTLISRQCGDSFKSSKIHVPATNTTPTYTTTNQKSNIEGVVEGSIDTPEGTLYLVNTPSSSALGSAHVFYLVDKNLNGVQKTVLTNLNSNRSYSVYPQQQGFVIYNSQIGEAYYYQSINSSPKTLTIPKPDDTATNPIGTQFLENGTITMVAYSNNTQFGQAENNQNTQNITVVNIINNNQQSTYKFDQAYSQALICQQKYLCMATQSEMDVFLIQNNQSSFVYRITNVSRIHQSPSNFLVVINNGILAMDIEKQQGYLYYSFGQYKFSNITSTKNGVIVTLINSRGNPVALQIDETQPSSDLIDKEIQSLLNDSRIKDVSVYRNIIYVSPDLGEPKFDSTSGIFQYDSAKTLEMQKVITDLVNQSGINTTIYKVINPLTQ